MNDKFLSISEARKYLNVSRATIDRWQAKGAIHPTYTPGGHRRFREADLRAAIGLEEQAPTGQTRAVIYARVSTRKQADSGNLTRQEERLVTYAVKKGYQVIATLTEIASGINEQRPQLRKGLQLIAEKKTDVLVVEFKDRLARFGYNYLELFITTMGGRIEVMQATETKSPNEELVEDLIAIITSFSARIYGKRGKRVSDQVSDLLRGELGNDDSGDDVAGEATGSLS
jgi:excisionase family DNA binding protein